jgi:hypothetical protein
MWENAKHMRENAGILRSSYRFPNFLMVSGKEQLENRGGRK